MNCKKGDLARVISTPDTRRCGVVDLFVLCEEKIVSMSGDVAWTIPLRLCACGCGSRLNAIADEFMRPIDNPGDGVKSQETRKLPADAGIVHLRETVRAFQAMRDAGVCP